MYHRLASIFVYLAVILESLSTGAKYILHMSLDSCLQIVKDMLTLLIPRFHEFWPENNFNLSSKVNYLRAFTLTPSHELPEKNANSWNYTQGVRRTKTMFLSKS